MKGFLTVLRVQLNASFGFSALKYRFRKEKDKIPQTMLLAAALAVTLGGLVALYTFLMGSIHAAGAASGRPEIVLVMAVLGLQVFLLLTGIFYVIGVFYYSRDMAALVPLPLSPWQVLGGKFAVVLAYEYLIAVPVLLPPMILYGAGQGAGILYWLKAALLIVVSPATPLLLSSLAAMALMRMMNLSRRRDLLAVAGGVLATAGILAFNLLAQRFAMDAQGPEGVAKLLSDQAGFLNTAAAAFPPAAWAALALSQSGWTSAGYLLLFVALSAALLALLLWLAERFYYRSAALMEETGKRTGPAPRRAGAIAASRASGPVGALFRRELVLLVRTPAFAMNCLAGSLLIPIILPVSMLQGEASTAGIRALITNPSNSLYVTLGAAALMALVSIVNATASTALSREGKTFWVSRMIPVEPQRQVYAKFLASYAVAAAGLVLTAVMLGAFFGLSPWRCALALALGLLGAIPTTIVNMLPDIIKPKLSWTNPYEAVKQNLNVLLAMLAGCFVVGVQALAAVLLALLRLPEIAVYAALTVVMAGQALAGSYALKVASGRYYRIEA